MSTSRVVGFALLILGAILLALGYQGAHTVGDRLKHAFTGDFSDRTVFLLLGGGVLVVIGLLSSLMPAKASGYSG